MWNKLQEKKIYGKVILPVLILLMLSSCHSTAPRLDYKKLAQASVRMNIDIDMNDNHTLYIESAEWIGVPYRGGGNSKRGVDCSGLTAQIYKKVYNISLKRNSNEQQTENCRKINNNNLREGDLVFFHNGRNKRTASHVGIYLKDNKFIHASTSQGVIISSLNEQYYRKHWLSGGRVKN